MTTMLANPIPGKTDELEISSFYLGDALMGVPIDQIEEINHQFDLTPVPHTPAYVRGLINLRGQVVTVIDLRVALGLEPADQTRQSCNVVVRSRGEQIGIAVDRIADVVRTRWADVEPSPANVAGVDGQYFRGICKLPEGLLVILDVEKILSADQHTR
jgi:purine-binding chemotaxis protein CheW